MQFYHPKIHNKNHHHFNPYGKIKKVGCNVQPCSYFVTNMLEFTNKKPILGLVMKMTPHVQCRLDMHFSMAFQCFQEVGDLSNFTLAFTML